MNTFLFMLQKISLFLLIFHVQALEPGLGNLKIVVVEKLQKTGYIDGHFVIGALFPVHGAPSLQDDTDPLECGAIRGSEGIELVEAAFYAIDAINNDENLLPGIQLGITIKDDCGSDLVALYQTIKLIEEPKQKQNSSFPSKFTCGNKQSIDSPLIGMIGTASSASTLQAENLLKLFKIPQIGYSTSSADMKSPYFYLSVAPSDYHQAYMIIKLLTKFNWSYISIAYTDGHFGMNGKHILEQSISSYNICISTSVHVAPPNEEILFTHSVKQLFQDERAKVIVCFCDETALRIIFQEIRNQSLAGKFQIIISNDWPIDENAVTGFEEEALGSFMLSVHRSRIPEFDDYFLSRDSVNNERNPWFKEYWYSISHQNHTYSGISKSTYAQSPKISYVIETIRAFAQGLHNMHSDVCEQITDFCPKLVPFNTTVYMEYLTNLSFPFNGDDINFRFQGSPYIGRFDIYNFQNVNASRKYVKIGEYNCHHMEQENYSEAEFSHNLYIFGDIEYPNSSDSVQSVCSESCPVGQVRVHNSDLICCWSCVPCAETEFLASESRCQSCPEGSWPSMNKTVCKKIPITYMNWTDVKSLIIIAVSIFFICLTSITSYMFIKNRQTAVIKSSHRELHYIILCGTIILHCGSFPLLVKPNRMVCFWVKIIPTLGITLIYVPVLLMAGHIARLFDQSKKQHPNLNLRLTSLRAHLVIILMGITLEAVLFMCESTKAWFTPKVIYEMFPYRRGFLTCNFPTVRWTNYVFSFINIYMIYYSIKIRTISFNFNEAKFIAIFTFIQTATNIAFRIVYTSSDFQVISQVMCYTLDGFVTLLFLFFPKLYIIIWRPEKNTSDNFKPLIEQYTTT